jgi:5-formyltetrahydrofolate cyclo-ligase
MGSLSKQALRLEMNRIIQELPPGQLGAEGLAAAQILRETEPWQRHDTVLLFLSGSREIDTSPLLEAAFQDNKRVYIPVVKAEDMDFYRLGSAHGPWRRGAFGIREPEQPGQLLPPDNPALVVVPGLSFDHCGNRLGHGKAYYDRFFARGGDHFFRVGLCAEAQIADSIPVEPWDRYMNALCTGKRFFLI